MHYTLIEAVIDLKCYYNNHPCIGIKLIEDNVYEFDLGTFRQGTISFGQVNNINPEWKQYIVSKPLQTN